MSSQQKSTQLDGMSDSVQPADSVSQVSLRQDDEIVLMYEDEKDIYGAPPARERHTLSDLRNNPQSAFLYVTEDTLEEARDLLTDGGFYVTSLNPASDFRSKYPTFTGMSRLRLKLIIRHWES